MFRSTCREFVLLLALLAPALTQAATPVLNFSDLVSGPKTGNSDTSLGQTANADGAIVTVWGTNLGATQGTSKVFVNGAEARVYSWGNATAPADLYTRHKMQMVCFQVSHLAADGAGSMFITINGQNTNSLPFTVRSGKIFFVKTTGSDATGDGSWTKPFKSMPSAVGAMAAGDTTYVCDGVTQPNEDSYGGAVDLALRGAPGAPAAFVAYPGATVSVGSDNVQRGFSIWLSGFGYVDNWVLSKIRTRAYESPIVMGSDFRVVGCYVTAPTGSAAEGAIEGSGNNLFVLGCEVTQVGMPGASKLYHPIYISSARTGTAPRLPAESNREIAWNYLHDNNANRAINVYSEQDFTAYMSGHRIHHNFIINQVGGGMLLGQYMTGDNWVYDNVIANAGLGPDPADGNAQQHIGVEIQPGVDGGPATNLYFYNNTVYGCGWSGAAGAYATGNISIDRLNDYTLYFQNNIIYSTGQPYLAYTGTNPAPSAMHSVWFGAGTPPSFDTSAINKDPLFVNRSAGDFHLSTGSPAIDVGSSSVAPLVPVDFDNLARPQGAGFDIGAFEFNTGTPPPPQPPVINSFTATPASISSGQASTLAWNVSNFTSLSINQNVGDVSAKSSVSVSPAATTTYTLTATNSAGSVSKSVTVTVTAAPAGQTLLTTQQPAVTNANDGVAYELGMRFKSDTAGQIIAVRFWKASSETGTHTGHVWSATGTLLATATFSGETASGWQEQALSAPLSIAANTEYLVSVNTGGGYYVASNTGFATQIVNGHLSSIVGGNGRYGPAAQYPTQTYQSSNYFRDVRFVAGTSTNHAPVISSAASATPNPALTGQTVSFAAAATDADNDPLTYAWNFGDGASGSGASTSHAYAAAGSFTATVTVSDGHGGSASSSVTVTVNVSNSTVKRINSGGGAAGTFSADANFSGGNTYRTTTTIDLSGATNPAPQAVYQSERYGNFTYTIGGLSAGAAYTVRLHFAEIYWSSAGKRVFNVAINGQQVLANFDIYAAANGKFKALVKEFTASADASGQLAIVYSTIKDNAKSSGIEILTPAAAAFSAAALAPESADPSPALDAIDLGTVQPNRVFKLPLETPEAGAAAKKLHWTAAKGSKLPKGLHVSGTSVGGKLKTAGTYSFELQLKTGDGKTIHNTYSITVQP